MFIFLFQNMICWYLSITKYLRSKTNNCSCGDGINGGDNSIPLFLYVLKSKQKIYIVYKILSLSPSHPSHFHIISIQFTKKYTSLTQPRVPQHFCCRLSFTGIKYEHFQHEITRLLRLLFRQSMLLKALSQGAGAHLLPPNAQEAPIRRKVL